MESICKREAMVIAAFLFLGLIIFFSWGIFISLAQPKYPFTYQQIKNEPNKYDFAIAGHGFQIELEGRVTRQVLYEKAMEIAEHTSIIKPNHFYRFLTDSKNIGLFIAFGGGYFIYLLLRYIIWAISTLK